jgi:transcriptional regulator with XRE-family HTH domain
MKVRRSTDLRASADILVIVLSSGAQNLFVQGSNTLGHHSHAVNLHLYSVPMNPVQLRMARAAVGWGVRELAERAGVTANTVTRIENGADAKQSTMEKLRHALEEAGIEFTNGDRPGVRLRNASFKKVGRTRKAAKAIKVLRRKTVKS